MAEIGRREFIVGATGLVAAACSGGGGGDAAPTSTTTTTTAPGSSTTTLAPTTAAPGAVGGLPAPGATGLVDEAFFQGQIDAYLAHAAPNLRAGSPSGVAVQLAAARRDPDYTWDIDAVTVDAFESRWTQLDEWRDTRDFVFMYFNWMLAHGQGDTPMTALDPGVIEAITQRMLDNRYRWDDPLPEGRIDHLWYWSENHRIITLHNEYLAGQFFPDETFTITGLTGAEQRERARPEILEWIHERAEFGFFEWHSNVYMAKNITPLLSLVELTEDDDEIVRAAAMALDLCLVDMATHYHQGAYVAPMGRTYKKDKMSALDEDVYDVAKFLFDETPTPHQSVDSTTTTFFCLAERYRPPAVMLEIARDDSVTVTRERHGIHINTQEPISDSPEAPFGYDFKDKNNLPFWWSAGAIGVWQITEVSVAAGNEHNLWDGDVFTQIKLLADLHGRDVGAIEQWLVDNWMILNLGGLDEANTYAWRSPEVSLASVLDHRKGEMRDQIHAWQATIDPYCRVFTQHPMTGLPESTDWSDDDAPGYWTGEASIPRAAQHEKTAILVYSPLYDETTDPILASVFGYRDYTHAFFPQEHFDEVRQVGNWTFGARNGGYIALWSWRAPRWREYDPDVHATNGMTQPFDLLAEGGPTNVWICEVGREADDGSFDEFVAAVTASEPVVAEGNELAVTWDSPSSGEVGFGFDSPFTVAGAEVAIGDFPRHDSPWGTVDRLQTHHRFETGGAVLDLDFDNLERSLEA
ncbi:MAG: hypothetical protein R8F63_05800 [Acidimicrobiales bacterium]|nr:hypothetical protein [Acidimicrobiales bacterium]